MSDKRQADDQKVDSQKKLKLEPLTITKDNCIVLNTGAKMPLLGFGTFKSSPEDVVEAVRTALKTGYRHIDCAKIYENEKEIGGVFAEVFGDPKSGIRREDVFVTSKIPPAFCEPKQVIPTLKSTLADLKLDYLDLYLIHLPFTLDAKGKPRKGAGFGLQDLWRAMEEAYETGLARAIGVSNYNTALMTDLLCYAKVPPAVNQIERHPYLVQQQHVKYCCDNGVAVTAFASLGAPGLFNLDLLKDPVVLKLAEEYKRTPAQILIRWSIDTEIMTIPKSVKPKRIVENFDVLSWSLKKEDVQRLTALDKNERAFKQDWAGIPLFS